FSLIASLPVNDPALAAAAWENGAHAVKVHINVSHRASKTLFKGFAEERPALERILAEAKGPVGIVLGGDPLPARRDLEDVIKAGFDFISIYAHHAPTELLDGEITKMLAADYSYTGEAIKNLVSCADVFEASIIHPESYGEELTLKDIITYKTICGSIDIPVVVPTQKRIRPGEVKHLYHAGVSAVMIGAISAGKTAAEFGGKTAEFRKTIDALEERGR
ncbi:MAG: hypothetical protein LBP42_07505, partial [Treponema sp.]|nr:hypothetical protein [Treponema sp.]